MDLHSIIEHGFHCVSLTSPDVYFILIYPCKLTKPTVEAHFNKFKYGTYTRVTLNFLLLAETICGLYRFPYKRFSTVPFSFVGKILSSTRRVYLGGAIGLSLFAYALNEFVGNSK